MSCVLTWEGRRRPGSSVATWITAPNSQISGNDPEHGSRSAISDSRAESVSNLKSIKDPRFNKDNVTILLVKGASDRRCGFRRIENGLRATLHFWLSIFASARFMEV
jgi:hypothetical protein